MRREQDGLLPGGNHLGGDNSDIPWVVEGPAHHCGALVNWAYGFSFLCQERSRRASAASITRQLKPAPFDSSPRLLDDPKSHRRVFLGNDGHCFRGGRGNEHRRSDWYILRSAVRRAIRVLTA